MADTRTRILDVAWDLVRDRGLNDVRVADVAAAAGVSRQLVYFHFSSRAGLLLAMARHRDAASGFVERVEAARRRPAEAALEALLRAWRAYIPELLPVARALEAAAIAGDEGGAAWRDRMDALHATFRAAVERVELADGWTVDTAADWIWARTHLTAYEQLVGERGWAPAEYTERVTRSVLAEVLA